MPVQTRQTTGGTGPRFPDLPDYQFVTPCPSSPGICQDYQFVTLCPALCDSGSLAVLLGRHLCWRFQATGGVPVSSSHSHPVHTHPNCEVKHDSSWLISYPLRFMYILITITRCQFNKRLIPIILTFWKHQKNDWSHLASSFFPPSPMCPCVLFSHNS